MANYDPAITPSVNQNPPVDTSGSQRDRLRLHLLQVPAGTGLVKVGRSPGQVKAPLFIASNEAEQTNDEPA